MRDTQIVIESIQHLAAAVRPVSNVAVGRPCRCFRLLPSFQKGRDQRDGAVEAVVEAVFPQLQERKQQPAGESCSVSSQLHLSDELLMTEARGPGCLRAGPSLNRRQHSLAHLTVGRLAHHRQHLERRQRMKSFSLIPEIESRHKDKLTYLKIPSKRSQHSGHGFLE